MIERRHGKQINRVEEEFCQYKFELFQQITYIAIIMAAFILTGNFIIDYIYIENSLLFSLIFRLLPTVGLLPFSILWKRKRDRLLLCRAAYAEILLCVVSFTVLVVGRALIFKEENDVALQFIVCTYMLMLIPTLLSGLLISSNLSVLLYSMIIICSTVSVFLSSNVAGMIISLSIIVPVAVQFIFLERLYDNTIRKEFNMQKELEHKMYHDALTGLYNRNIFSKITTNDYLPSNRYSVIMIDIDFFKKVNDEWSHDKGDEILSRLGNVMNVAVRDSDYAIRWGGEELIVLLNTQNPDNVKNIARRIKAAFYVANQKDADECKPTLSIGCFVCRNDMKYEKNIDMADKALYFVKQNGRNNIAMNDNNDIYFIG